MLTNEKILISGVTGMVARPLAEYLARDNEVWGVARFSTPQNNGGSTSRPSARDELESLGITTRSVDFGVADFSDLPNDFTYVLHLAWMRADLSQLQEALRSNVEGAGLLLHHCRRAKAALVMSGMGVYSPHPDPWHPYGENDPMGRGATAYAATSPACKLGLEAVARYCARVDHLPITIARLNTFMGGPSSFPGMHIRAALNGQPMVAPFDPSPHTPIHTLDMQQQLEALLDAARTPAFTVNWCGDKAVTVQEWMAHIEKRSGRPAPLEIRSVPGSPAGNVADGTRRNTVTGPCQTNFWEKFDQIYDEIEAELSPQS